MSNVVKIKSFIKARSPRRLRLLMYQKQMKLGMVALEFDVLFDSAKNEYVAWYYEIVSNETLTEIINGNTTNK